jgi:hypothetical protein
MTDQQSQMTSCVGTVENADWLLDPAIERRRGDVWPGLGGWIVFALGKGSGNGSTVLTLIEGVASMRDGSEAQMQNCFEEVISIICYTILELDSKVSWHRCG